jgi:hypothetical protein
MGTRLRRLLEEKVGPKLQDGNTVEGKERLSKFEIDKFQNYRGLAVRRNINNLEAT